MESPYANKLHPGKIIAKKINRNTFPNGWREIVAILCSTSYHVSCLLQTLAAVLKNKQKLKKLHLYPLFSNTQQQSFQ